MIRTAEKLDAQGRRLGRINSRTARILELMQRRGVTLHLDQSGTRPVWWLSTGERVDEQVAALLVGRPSIVGVGDALIAGVPSQTYRYAED